MGNTTHRGALLTERPLAMAFRVFYPHDPTPLVLCPECFISVPLPEGLDVDRRTLVLAGSCCDRCGTRIA